MQAEATKIKEKMKLYAQEPKIELKNDLLKIISSLCKNHDSIKTLKIQAASKLVCMLCQKYINPEMANSYYRYDCDRHCYTTCHITCLKDKAMAATKGFLDNEELMSTIRCDCGQKISSKQWEFQIFGKADFDKIISDTTAIFAKTFDTLDKIDYEKNKKKVFKCLDPNCLKEIPIAETVILDCHHTFCKPCLKIYIDNTIDNGEKNLIKCPLQECHDEIHWETIAANSDEKKLYIYNIRMLGDENLIFCGKCMEAFDSVGQSVKAGFVCSKCKLLP